MAVRGAYQFAGTAACTASPSSRVLEKNASPLRGWDASAITLYRLRIFCEVVDQRSFTVAAEQLHLTQPAVSLQIRALERAINAELLYQDGHRTLLTQAGETFYQYARDVLQQAGEMQARLQDLTTGLAGCLNVGATRTPGTYLLPAILNLFVRANERASVNVYVEPTQTICARALRGELDLGLVQMVKIPDGLVSRPLRRERLVIVASPRHPLACAADVRLQSLADMPFACAPLGTATRTVVDESFRVHGLERPHVVVQFTHPESIKRVVQGGDLLAVLCEASVKQELDFGVLRVVQAIDFEAWQEFGLVYRPRKHFSPLLKEFATLLQTELSVFGQAAGTEIGEWEQVPVPNPPGLAAN
jgi:DNA-binding transcriptional LysR family regulator